MALYQYESVFITGCSRGIGLEFVKQFVCLAKPPKHIIATSRKIDEASELYKLGLIHDNLHVFQLDVTSPESIREATEKATSILQGSGLSLLINNAGLFVNKGLDDIEAEDMIEVFKTQTVAPLMITKSLLGLLKQAARSSVPDLKTGKALIVNISSKTSLISDNHSGGMYASRASKCALNMVTKSLSVDLKKDGILAVAVNPGFVKTRKEFKDAAPLTPEESVLAMMKTIDSIDESKSGLCLNYSGEVLQW
ncbi:predicted protein [Nematostella vectensis]|uniref:C-factor n=1 Tax=Nematostella vectensis TaxID=45351 RepID=A7RI22_NEMVE|nr:C-factor [Nematostella vectensis]EDO49074.1 predicted protein [Nematostella vectensis]|eukprot:XP_001641137.1 predicted protein [Nematostella vectensis]